MVQKDSCQGGAESVHLLRDQNRKAQAHPFGLKFEDKIEDQAHLLTFRFEDSDTVTEYARLLDHKTPIVESAGWNKFLM